MEIIVKKFKIKEKFCKHNFKALPAIRVGVEIEFCSKCEKIFLERNECNYSDVTKILVKVLFINFYQRL